MADAASNDTIFGRILRGEIPCDQVYADEQCLAFRDVAPQAPVHILVIPREHVVNLAEAEASHCLLYTSPSPRDQRGSRMPSSA